MNMSRIENYNKEQKLYLLYCIRGVVDTAEDARKDTTTMLRRKSVWDDLSHLTVDFPAEDRAARHI